MTTLFIESSSQLCLVGLVDRGQADCSFLAPLCKSVSGAKSHSENMLAFCEQLINEAGITFAQLDAVAFSQGPGSFTGIRIAASIIKTIAYVHQLPVIVLDSMQLSAQSAVNLLKPQIPKPYAWVLRDARMGELYSALYQYNSDTGQYDTVDKAQLPTQQLLTVDESAQQSLVQSITNTIACDDIVLLHDLGTKLPSAYSVIRDQYRINDDAVDTSKSDALELTIQTQAVESVIQQAIAKQQFVTAIEAEPLYLRTKTAWKNIEQQKAHRKKQA